MISVGIDVSKEKSTICILKPYGEIVSKPFEVCHTEKGVFVAVVNPFEMKEYRCQGNGRRWKCSCA